MSGEEGALRPVDLARMAGVSTRRALMTYQALEKGYGLDTALAIMRAVHAGDLPRALTLVDAGHAALHEERQSLQTVAEALDVIAEQAPDPGNMPRSGMRIGDVAAYLGIRTSALRVWESAGLLTPQRHPTSKYRLFGLTDVRDARMISMLRQSRYPLPQIQLVLDGLRETGGSDALREAIAQRQARLIEQATAMLEGSSHLHHYVTRDEAVEEPQ